MGIKIKLIIDLPDGTDYSQHINVIKNQLSNINGLETLINVNDIDDPMSISPISIRKIKELND